MTLSTMVMSSTPAEGWRQLLWMNLLFSLSIWCSTQRRPRPAVIPWWGWWCAELWALPNHIGFRHFVVAGQLPQVDEEHGGQESWRRRKWGGGNQQRTRVFHFYSVFPNIEHRIENIEWLLWIFNMVVLSIRDSAWQRVLLILFLL